jgi:hypothetical protein
MAIALVLGMSVSGCGGSAPYPASPRAGSALAASSVPTAVPRLGTSFEDTAVTEPDAGTSGGHHHHHHHHGGAHAQ